MKSFKVNFPNSIKTEIKFKEWKIKENSILSKGSIIFTYEYELNGILKLEKYKSNFNEITVKQIVALETGDLIKNGMEIFAYEKCAHPIIIKNEMCGVCGEDLRKRDEIVTKISNIASIPIVHAEPRIKVSEKEANDIGKRDLMNLVKNRKLVLLVDLDHTLIHTTNDNVSNQLKDVYHYELVQKGIWYHTKFRPGCKKFLEEMSKLYELHMVTFGERKYAHTIASFMDPDKRYFHDRILSRNEIINPISKTDNLKALFPRGDLMVCIIDDREDVWNYARNLICVQPYVYFKNTGDINDPHANTSSTTKTTNRKRKLQAESDNSVEAIPKNTSINTMNTKEANSEEATFVTLSVSKASEPNLENENSSNSENSNNSTDSSTNSSTNNSSKTKQEAIVEKKQQSEAEDSNNDDPDDYLIYLQEILKKIHDEYYSIYEARLKSQNKSLTKTDEIDEADLPDVKKVIPLIKSRILENVVVTFSGVVPVGTSPQYDLKRQRCYLMAKSLGAKVNENLVFAEQDENENENVKKEAASAKTSQQEKDANDNNQKNNKNRRYQYNFDDEYSSNSSGGEFKSEDEEEIYEEVETYYNYENSNNENISDSNSNSNLLDKKNINNKQLVKKKLKKYTTHLVGAKYGTSKVHDALKFSKRLIKVVTPEWLINCNFKWIKCDENDYRLTKEYEYKNCIFHQEYNLYQKYSSNTSTTSTKSVFSLNKRNLNDLSKHNKVDVLNINNKNEKFGVVFKKNEISYSISSLESSNSKKSKKSNEEVTITSSITKSNLNINSMSEDIFEMMDKEVNDELEDDDDDEVENNNEEKDDLTDDDDDDYGDDADEPAEMDFNRPKSSKTVVKFKDDLKLTDDSSNSSFSKSEQRHEENNNNNNGGDILSSSSLNSSNCSIDSIDDEFGLELEKDFLKDLKKQP